MRNFWKSAQTPTRDSKYYAKLLEILRLTATLLPFSLLPIGLLSKYGIIDARFYAGDIWFMLIYTGFTLTAVAQYYVLGVWPSPLNYMVFSIIYHVLSSFYLLFVTGMLAPVFIFWVVLTMAVDIYFGRIAYLLSMLALAITVVANLILHPILTSQEQFIVILNALFIAITAFVFSKLRSVNDQERLALIKTRGQENFQRERLLALVNSMGDAVVTTDETGTIKIYNAAFLGLLDTNTDLVGKNIDKVMNFRDKSRRLFKSVKEAGQKHAVISRDDLSHQFADGEIIKLYTNIAPIRTGFQSRAERGYIYIMRDITKEKSLEEERDEFVSVISHELRTPVAIAEGNLSNIKLLQEHKAAPSVIAHAVDDAHEQVLYLSKLINDLGALARAERGVTNPPEEIDPADIMTNLYQEYLPSAQDKKLMLDLDLDPQLQPVYVSKLYLEEILQNLITNAIKYTKQGNVAVGAHKLKDGSVQFFVKDSGIGIGKSDQKHIFEKFYRSEDYRTRESSGTGLGLYVSQKLAEKMGITLDFESRLNHGSTFILTIRPQESQTKVVIS